MSFRIILLIVFSAIGVPAMVGDLGPLSDEFDDPASLANWRDLGVVEG